MDDWRAQFLTEIGDAFRSQRRLAEMAVAQLDRDELFRNAGEEDNSVAVLMKHVGGNLRSRWSDPFDTDGEKPDRDRDGEFEVTADDAARVRGVWEAGWGVLESVIDSLQPSDLDRPITIRGEPHTLIKALLRSVTHTAQHAGQIILLAKHWRGSNWRTLSIPRGQSSLYTGRVPPAPQ